jgi:hypothetical protein
MKRLPAIGLILTIGWQPVAAAGPLERSLSREASRLARELNGETDWPGWRAVHLLQPGTPIVVTTAEAVVAGGFFAIDDSTMAVSKGGAIEHVNLGDVQMVERRVRRGSALAAVFGTLGGIWLGSGLGFAMAESSGCYRSCGGTELAIWSAIIGFPIVGGYGAWRSTSHVAEEVIYRRPRGQP